MEARESDIGFLLQTVAVGKLNLVGKYLKTMKKGHYSLILSLQLTQKGMERVRKEVKEKGALTKILREAAEGRKRSRGVQDRGP